MLCFQMETVCFELFLRPYSQYSLDILRYESCWLVIESNERLFGGLCFGTLQSHCKRMRMASTFGTKAELQAAASLFQIFIYVFHKRSEERGWEWIRYKPYTKESLSYSGVSIPDAPDPFHIEILYNEAGSHFDLVVPLQAHILSPPQLPGLHTTLSIDLS